MRFRCSYRSCGVCCLLLLSLAATAMTAGCLSLGGTTTHVHEDPRVDALENRVSALERILRGPAMENAGDQ